MKSTMIKCTILIVSIYLICITSAIKNSQSKTTKILSSRNGYTGQFLHLSDVHYSSVVDSVKYNSTTYCMGDSFDKKLISHHHQEDEQHLFSGNIGPDPSSGLFGRYGCDTNYLLFNSTMEELIKRAPNPDFIIYTGDSAGHTLPQGDWLESMSTFAKTVAIYYPNTTFIPTVGNNDVFPDYNTTCSDGNLLYLSVIWGNWIPDDQFANFTKFGSFSVKPVPGLRVISLNTVLYSTKNKNTFDNDPCGQFQWLEDQFNEASMLGEQVYVIGHIFPGIDTFFMLPTWKNQYIVTFFDLIQEYSSVVTAGFFGHIHRDEFRVASYDIDTYFPIFIGSSITPLYQNNPSFKIYHYNRAFNVTNFQTYYTDIYSSNLMSQLTWHFEYSFLEQYLINDNSGINGQVLNQLIQNMQTSPALFDAYNTHRSSNYLQDTLNIYCVTSSLNPQQFLDCLQQHNFSNSKKLVAKSNKIHF
eukprot:gene7564-9299_t